MANTYIRVDDRLIHGQIVTAWVKTLEIKRILAIDDTIAKNTMMKSIVTMGVPKHIEAKIVTEEEAKRYLQEASDRNTLVIVRFARDLKTLFDVLKDASVLNIGNCSKQDNAKLTLSGLGVGQTISLSEEDIETLDIFDNQGVEVVIQQLPSDKITHWKSIKR